MSRLALGTVQFGLAYGVANAAGQVPAPEVARILDAARAAGIDTLDTAQGYGTAETVLGAAGIDGFRVIGKIGRVDNPGELAARVRASLGRLRIARFAGLLLHDPDQMHDLPGLAGALDAIRDAGLAQAVGWSVYDPDQTARLLAIARPDLVQLPLCALDGRWGAMLDRLARLGVRVHLRSAYLQGLLLMPQPPAWTTPWAGLLTGWRDWVAAQGTTPARAALALALAQPVDRVVIGVDSTAQLAEVLDLPALPPLPDHLKTTDPALLDPRHWPPT